MTTTFTRMLQRGRTEAEILSSTDVPLEREIVVASDTGVFWIGNGVDPASALPKQGPAQPTGVAGIVGLPTGEAVPTVDRTTSLLPKAVREALGEAIRDPGTPEGAAVAAAAGGGSTPSESGYDLVLAIGQSNMAGRGTPFSSMTDPVNPRIFQFPRVGSAPNTIQAASEPLRMPDSAAGMGPALQFARWYAARRLATNRKVLIIPAAVGGTPLSADSGPSWRPGLSANLYASAVSQTLSALTAAGPGSRVVAALWLQGETDGDRNVSGAQYQADLDALITSLRDDLDVAALPFVIGTMVPEYLSTGTRAQINAVHRDTPNRIAGTDVAVSAVAMNAGDGNHFNGPGQRFNGKAMFDAFERITSGLMPYSEIGKTVAPVVSVEAVAATSVSLTWPAVAGAVSYAVAYRISGGDWVDGPAPTVANATVTGLKSSTKYELRVTALSAAGNYSEASNIVTATTQAATTAVLGVAGAAQAYSLRKVADSSYTGKAVNVRRSSDSTTTDIGFVSGALDTAALLAFAGSGDAFVATWYDQSGNGRDITQATAAAQPKIVSAGALVTSGGKPAATFDGVDDCLVNSTPVLFAAGSATALQVLSAAGSTTQARVWSESVSSSSSGQYGLLQPDGATSATQGFAYPLMSGVFAYNTAGMSPTRPFYAAAIHQGAAVDTGSAMSSWIDGVADLSGFAYSRPTSVKDRFTLGGVTRSGSLAPRAMTFSELVTFSRALSDADRQAAAASQKAFYGTP
jgi:hypothetical protein